MSDVEEDLARSSPFSCPIEVRFSDIDAMGHVNNAVTVTYLEIARVRLWRERLGFVGHACDLPFILARVAIDYRSPIHFGDEVVVRIGVSRVGGSSFTLVYRVEASGRPGKGALEAASPSLFPPTPRERPAISPR